MRISSVISSLVFSIFLGVLATVNAAPLELKHISAEASWLGHVDIDAMRDSIVVKKAMEKHRQSGKMEMCKKFLGMDPDKDLHGVSFYGKEVEKHKGVMILHARMNRERIMGMVMMFAKPTTSEHGKHKLHRWTHKSRHHDKTHTMCASFYDEDTVVMASSIDELKHAIDVLDGKASSLTDDSSLGGNIPAGTTMLMRIEGISKADLPDKKCCGKIAKQTESFRFVTGEHEGESFYRARAIMTNEAIVGHGKEIIEGLKALGYLHVGDNEIGKRLVDGLEVRPRGKSLTILWSGAAEDVWTMIEAHNKIFAEKMKERYKHRGSSHHYDWRKRWHHHYKKSGPKKDELPPEEDF